MKKPTILTAQQKAQILGDKYPQAVQLDIAALLM
jgi:hypothetical protein